MELDGIEIGNQQIQVRIVEDDEYSEYEMILSEGSVSQ